MKHTEPSGETYFYLAPSGVQKERIECEDLFVLKQTTDPPSEELTNLTQQFSIPLQLVASPPAHKKFNASQCTPLFFAAYEQCNAQAVIHTHSQAAVLVTLLHKDEFVITHQEMIKGIRVGSTKQNLQYYDRLVVPIIENTPHECDLTTLMKKALEKYPSTNAVLVRRHGVYVWGETWQKAKTMCECYDYLFEIAIEMHKLGIDYSKIPEESPYKHLVK